MFKNLLLALCLFQACFLFSLKGDETYWDSNLVRAYVHHSDLQRRWAMAFLAPHLRQLKGDEHILDMGCGDGKLTSDVSKFIPEGLMIGIDPSLPMLEWARKQYCPLEYPNLIFQEGGFLEPNQPHLFDIVLSTCALQHCPDQNQAFKNLAKLLKPNRQVWLLIPAMDNVEWKEAVKNVKNKAKWASYWTNFQPRKFLELHDYAHLLKEANLHLLKIAKIQTADPFVDREEFLNFLLGTFNPAVPKSKAHEFYDEVITEYLRLLPEAIDEKGVIEARFGRIEIEAAYIETR